MQVAYICMFLNYGYVCLSYMCFLCQMDPYGVNMMSGASIATHIALLHARIETHAQDLFSEFHSITVRAHRLHWCLPAVHLWVEFRLCYHHYIVIGNPGQDDPMFLAQGALNTITTELLLREEFEQREITMETLQHVFPLHQAHPPPTKPQHQHRDHPPHLHQVPH